MSRNINSYMLKNNFISWCLIFSTFRGNFWNMNFKCQEIKKSYMCIFLWTRKWPFNENNVYTHKTKSFFSIKSYMLKNHFISWCLIFSTFRGNFWNMKFKCQEIKNHTCAYFYGHENDLLMKTTFIHTKLNHFSV